jgi:glycosyltransferase involved in cell wall biosynthesis
VVCDGGSTDGTLALLEAETRLSLRVIHRSGANISTGRNIAIAAATGDVIAVTDAGVWLETCWLQELVSPLEAAPSTHVVSGFFRPDPRSVFEIALGATILPELRDIRPASFLPSSRSVAFRKHAWEAVGGYPEWLDYCEDLVFDILLRNRYETFAFSPDALVHFRPRTDLRAFFLQYYRYARGDGKANLWWKRHAARYGTYLIGAPLIALGGVWITPWLWTLALISIPGMFWAGWRRLPGLWNGLSWVQKAWAIALVPVIRVVGDLAKMIGYPTGLRWRVQHRREIPDWRSI